MKDDSCFFITFARCAEYYESGNNKNNDMLHDIIKPHHILFYIILIYQNQTLHSQNCDFQYQQSFLPPIADTTIYSHSIAITHEQSHSIQFHKVNQQTYIKVIYDKIKPNHHQCIQIRSSELEIKSDTKSYYKKNIPIYQEADKLFFAIPLPPNYIKTLAEYGITEIIVDTKTMHLHKKETNQIKQIAQCLLNSK